VLVRARADDVSALEILFAQFIPPREDIVETRYMGLIGVWGIGTHSFAAVTTERFASLKIGLFGAVTYQDGSLEYINSSAIHQPSRLRLYLPAVLWVLAVVSIVLSAWLLILFPLGGPGQLGAGLVVVVLASFLIVAVALLLVPLVVRLTYGFVKSGLTVWIREGPSVVIFIDRKRITLANRLYRLCAELRDERLREIGHP